jgi:hypothetical protein
MSRMPERRRPGAPPHQIDHLPPERGEVAGYLDPPAREPPESWPGSPEEAPLPLF